MDTDTPSSRATERAALAKDPPYSEGPVWSVQFMRAERGRTLSYLASLRSGWKPVMEAAKEKGLILGYRVLISPLAHPDDWDVVLVIELPNMAALDGYNEKLRELGGGLAAPGNPDGSALHELMGMKLLREAILT
ncbi:hypothetical protein ACFWIA_02660 [Streptomyces sp. NPDC127068]|uniref:hypothetical protein n=1 Tax=Streptomyces sp. NPDC127068 TaxID=3347127 RepID=UPI00364ACA77